jgi:hypothetical protein
MNCVAKVVSKYHSSNFKYNKNIVKKKPNQTRPHHDMPNKSPIVFLVGKPPKEQEVTSYK